MKTKTAAHQTTAEDLPDPEDEDEEHESAGPKRVAAKADTRMPRMRPTTPITDVQTQTDLVMGNETKKDIIFRRKQNFDPVWKTFVVAAESDMPCDLYTVTCSKSYGGSIKVGFKTAMNASRFLEGNGAFYFDLDPTNEQKQMLWVDRDEKVITITDVDDSNPKNLTVRSDTERRLTIPDTMLEEGVAFYPCVVGHCEFQFSSGDSPFSGKEKKGVAKKRRTWVVGVFEKESIEYRKEFGNDVASEKDLCRWARASWWNETDGCPSRPPSVWVYWQLVMQWPHDPLFIDLWGSQFSEGTEGGSYDNMARIFHSKLTRPNSRLESARVKAFIPKELELALEKKSAIPSTWKIKYRQPEIASSDSSATSSSSEDESRRAGRSHRGKKNSRNAKNAPKSKAANLAGKNSRKENQRPKRTNGRSHSRPNARPSHPRTRGPSGPRERYDPYAMPRAAFPFGKRVVLDDSPRCNGSPRGRGRMVRSPRSAPLPDRYSDDRMGDFESRRVYGPGTSEIYDYGPRDHDVDRYESRDRDRRRGPYDYRRHR